MTGPQPAFYARTGSRVGDLVALMHLPYTMWHLSYVVIGAALAPRIDAWVLAGTVVAFGFGLGIGAHALDELHDRPLSTGLSTRTLRVLGWGGLVAGGVMAVAASFVVSPVAFAWGVLGVVLAASYSLEWPPWMHTATGFALAWGAFPVLVGYWAQTEKLTVPVVVIAASATVLSLVQRSLSTPARHVRRSATDAIAVVRGERWDQAQILATWERPLQLLTLAQVLLAIGLLLTHVSP
jgi:hypothetical protein